MSKERRSRFASKAQALRPCLFPPIVARGVPIDMAAAQGAACWRRFTASLPPT